MIPVLPVVLEPVLIDKGLVPYIAAIERLAWISFCAGKCITIRHAPAKKRPWIEPVAFDGNTKEHVSLLPNDNYGSAFGFWHFPKEVSITPLAGSNVHTTTCGLVVWYDITKVYPDDHDQRTSEHIKLQLLNALRHVPSPGTKLVVSSVTDIPAQVYVGFQVDEARMQHMTRPFGALRIDFVATFDEAELC
jgi:hypothetical protein